MRRRQRGPRPGPTRSGAGGSPNHGIQDEGRSGLGAWSAHIRRTRNQADLILPGRTPLPAARLTRVGLEAVGGGSGPAGSALLDSARADRRSKGRACQVLPCSEGLRPPRERTAMRSWATARLGHGSARSVRSVTASRRSAWSREPWFPTRAPACHSSSDRINWSNACSRSSRRE